jgi:sugar lactone lactonase YvrE
MRHSALQVVTIASFAAALAAAGHGLRAEEPYAIPFVDFVKIVDATLCGGQKVQKVWNAPCEPQNISLASASGTPGLVVTCPTCVTALTVQGAVANGRLRATRDGAEIESSFRTEAPNAGELATVAARLYAHYDDRYFVQAKRPRGLTLDDGALLVADFGAGQGDGHVWRVPLATGADPIVASVSGEPITDALPSVAVLTDFQGQAFKAIVGISAVRRVAGGLLALTNRVAGKRVEIPDLRNFPLAALLRIPGSAPGRPHEIVASLFDFEARFDPDHDGVECNPYDFAVRGDQAFATDAAGNSVVRIDLKTGEMSLYAVFDEIPKAELGPDGKTTTDAVPTGLEFGPDGALYVASLGGSPFTLGTGRILKLADANRDGDALDPGEQTVAVTELTTPIDVTFDRHGTMYTAEESLSFMSQGFGRICRIDGGKCAHVVSDTVSGPTSLAVSGDYVYFSQEFRGRVSRVRLGAESTRATAKR